MEIPIFGNDSLYIEMGFQNVILAEQPTIKESSSGRITKQEQCCEAQLFFTLVSWAISRDIVTISGIAFADTSLHYVWESGKRHVPTGILEIQLH